MYKNILHATDLNEEHFELCQRAQAIAKCFGANFYLLHVISTPASLQLAQGLGFAEIPSPEGQIKEAQGVIQVLGQTLHIPKDRLFVEAGPIHDLVANKARDLNCQLLIIGNHSPGLWHLNLENSMQSILKEPICDVLTLS